MGLFIERIKEGNTLYINPDPSCPEWVIEVQYANNHIIAKELVLDYGTEELNRWELFTESDIINLINNTPMYEIIWSK